METTMSNILSEEIKKPVTIATNKTQTCQIEAEVIQKITDMIGGMITEQINYSINEPDNIGKVIHKYVGNKFIELRQKVLDECNSCGKSKLIEKGFCNCCGAKQEILK